MRISELKSAAKKMIAPHKSALYKASALILVLEIIFLGLSIILDLTNHEDAADNIGYIGDLLIYPVILANIAMIAKIYQGKDIESRDSLANYSTIRLFGKALAAYILPGIYVFLWTLPFVVISICSFIPVYLNHSTNPLLVVVFIVSLLISIIIAIIKGLQYGLNPYILGADNTVTVNQSIKLSKDLMKGYKWKMFLLTLSFIGWFFLVPFTLGIILIWLIPYYNATVYEFYNHIKSNTVTSEQNTEEIVEDSTTEK